MKDGKYDLELYSAVVIANLIRFAWLFVVSVLFYSAIISIYPAFSISLFTLFLIFCTASYFTDMNKILYNTVMINKKLNNKNKES